MARRRLFMIVLVVVFTFAGHLSTKLRGGARAGEAADERRPWDLADAAAGGEDGTARRLMAVEEAASRDKCSSTFDRNGGVVVYVAGVLFALTGLAIVCEEAFKDSLVELSSALGMPEDIAGATFMAAGTSSPELFTALVAVWSPEDDIGVGTIVGSAIFNILIIIGLSVLLSSHVFSLDWRPVMRDCIVNLIAFAYLLFVFRSGDIDLVEACVGFGLYVLYVALMGVNRYLMAGMSWLLRTLTFGRFGVEEEEEMKDVARASTVSTVKSFSNASVREQGGAGSDHESAQRTVDELLSVGEDTARFDEEHGQIITDSDEEERGEDVDYAHYSGGHGDYLPQYGADESSAASDRLLDDDDNGRIVMSINSEPPQVVKDDTKSHEVPTTVLKWVIHVLSWPWELLFSYTIPPASGKFKYQFVATFIMSLIWLAGLTYFMVGWTEIIGCILNIDDAVMGVTFLAIGTSMPDCLTSIAIARTGRGEMAVCNALGSNIFDILLALPLPWILSILLLGDDVFVNNDSLDEYVAILTICIVLFFGILMATKMVLKKTTGIIFVTLYTVFVVYSVLKELEIFSLF